MTVTNTVLTGCACCGSPGHIYCGFCTGTGSVVFNRGLPTDLYVTISGNQDQVVFGKTQIPGCDCIGGQGSAGGAVSYHLVYDPTWTPYIGGVAQSPGCWVYSALDCSGYELFAIQLICGDAAAPTNTTYKLLISWYNTAIPGTEYGHTLGVVLHSFNTCYPPHLDFTGAMDNARLPDQSRVGHGGTVDNTCSGISSNGVVVTA